MTTFCEKIPILNCSDRKNISKIDYTLEIKPFSLAFFEKLLILERKYIKSKTNINIVNDLVSFYSKLVEFFDAKNDTIRYYFHEKMQEIFTNYTLKKFMLNDSIELKNNDFIHEKLKIETPKGLNDISESINSSTNHYFKRRNTNQSLLEFDEILQKKQKERNGKIKLFLEIEEKKNSKLEITSQIVNSHLEKTNSNDFVIKSDLKKQMDHIYAKIKHRRANTLSLSDCNQNLSILSDVSRGGAFFSKDISKDLLKDSDIESSHEKHSVFKNFLNN